MPGRRVALRDRNCGAAWRKGVHGSSFWKGSAVLNSAWKARVGFARRPVLLAGLLCLGIAGCSGDAVPTGTVAGKVLLNDAPYTNASVVLLSLETGQGGTAVIQPDGTFRIEEPLPVGSYKAFLAPKPIVAKEGDEQPVKIDQSVPDKYWNEAMTDISIEIVEGENDVTVPLHK